MDGLLCRCDYRSELTNESFFKRERERVRNGLFCLSEFLLVTKGNDLVNTKYYPRFSTGPPSSSLLDAAGIDSNDIRMDR
jgi:hypothetical protein